MESQSVTTDCFRLNIATLLDIWKNRLAYHIDLQMDNSIVYTILWWDLTIEEASKVQSQCLDIFHQEITSHTSNHPALSSSICLEVKGKESVSFKFFF